MISPLNQQYQKQQPPIHLIQYPHSYILLTKNQYTIYFKKLLHTPSKPFSHPPLQLLPILSYKHPITPSEVEEITGVKSQRV
ncbi:SMC-Scp complex subunit ScpB, partial [Bacillus pumilus]|uniref:SMC-Scp complex subunit ScpB n=1 Tax=Bacillus pumilus TaxID=1408 RepID=UPI003703950E